MHLLQMNQVMHKLLQITVQSCKRECSVHFASKVLFFLSEKVLNFSVWLKFLGQIQNKKKYYRRSNSFEVSRSFSIWNLEAKFTFEKINLIKSLRKHKKQTLVHSKSEFQILAKIKDKKRLLNYLKIMFTFCLFFSVLLKIITKITMIISTLKQWRASLTKYIELS